jgi:sugar phosphate isomerase/epimerase
MQFSIVLSTHPAQFQAVAFKGGLEQTIVKVAGWGYSGVELAIRDPRLVETEALVQLISSHGLKVPAIGTGQAWGEEGLSFTSDVPAIRAAAVERALSHVPLAARLEAIIIIGLLRGITPKGQAHERSMDYLVEALKTCCAAADASGVRLALEPLNRYETDLIHTAADGLALIERVGAPNLGLLMDTFHMNIEEPSIEQSIRSCGRHMFHFHVADSNRWHPGAGHLDFASILATLRDTGYAGFVSGEFMPQPDADTAAQRGLAHLRRSSDERHAG